MASMIKGTLDGVEKNRLQLENNIVQLRKGLKIWQTWEAEYEAYKEELEALPPSVRGQVLISAGQNIDGELLKDKELTELTGSDKSIPRTAKQIIDLLFRRIEYVQQNVVSLRKQLQTAETKLADSNVLDLPHTGIEEGLPVTDILEELDEDGNVISSTISHPGTAAPELLSTLEKAGVQSSDLSDGKIDQSAAVVPGKGRETNSKISETKSEKDLPAVLQLIEQSKVSLKKSVSFAEGTRESIDAIDNTGMKARAPFRMSKTAPISGKAVSDGDETKLEPKIHQSGPRITNPVIPANESAEDAALRREMLEYSMNEVGSIVAQLDIDESDSAYSSGDEFEEDDEEELDISSGSEDENEFGINRGMGIPESYRREMLELEERLGASVVRNLGPQPNIGSNAVGLEGATAAVRQTGDAASPRIAKDKSVRFAEMLDIAPPLEPKTYKTESRNAARNSLPSGNIVERPPQDLQGENMAKQSVKPSRFKAARVASSQRSPATTMPLRSTSNTPLASHVIERPPTFTAAAQRPPSPPDELEPALHRQEIAQEYFRLRNTMIQKEGGFNRYRQEEQDADEARDERGLGKDGASNDTTSQLQKDSSEEDDDEPRLKKVSLFKAARLKRSGAT